jgi:hypothetical protein
MGSRNDTSEYISSICVELARLARASGLNETASLLCQITAFRERKAAHPSRDKTTKPGRLRYTNAPAR